MRCNWIDDRGGAKQIGSDSHFFSCFSSSAYKRSGSASLKRLGPTRGVRKNTQAGPFPGSDRSIPSYVTICPVVCAPVSRGGLCMRQMPARGINFTLLREAMIPCHGLPSMG